MFGRSRFRDVVSRQLALFEQEHATVIREAEERLDAYNRADRDDAEELYGDYVDALETGTEILADLRDHFAGTLADDDADRYVREFNQAVEKRLRPFALDLENR